MDRRQFRVWWAMLCLGLQDDVFPLLVSYQPFGRDSLHRKKGIGESWLTSLARTLTGLVMGMFQVCLSAARDECPAPKAGLAPRPD